MDLFTFVHKYSINSQGRTYVANFGFDMRGTSLRSGGGVSIILQVLILGPKTMVEPLSEGFNTAHLNFALKMVAEN